MSGQIVAAPSESIQVDSLGDYLLMLSEHLMYDAFDTKRFREIVVLEKKIPFQTICAVIVAYLQIGNNAQRLAGKIKVRATGEMVLKFTRELGMVSRASNGTDLTFPRFATAFAPLTWALRKHVATTLQSRVETTTPPEQRDLAFNGFGATRIGADSQDFIDKFSLVLAKAKDKAVDAAVVKSRQQAFAALVTAGLDRDRQLKAASNLTADKLTIPALMEEFSPARIQTFMGRTPPRPAGSGSPAAPGGAAGSGGAATGAKA